MIYIHESFHGWIAPSCDKVTMINIYREFDLYMRKENLIYVGF